MATRKDVKLFIEKRLKEMKDEEETEKEEQESERESEEEEEGPSVENKFANDGSFLELFKKKMAEQQDGGQKKGDQSLQPQTEKEDGGTQLKAYQAGVGQRKSLLKTMKLREQRKRRREEIEAEQKKEEEQDNTQSVAWRTYMREVRELQEKCCTEKDDHKRPLVK